MAKQMEHPNGGRRNPWRVAVWGSAALLLALPAIAMQFTREVNWDGADFLVMGLLLAIACGVYELGARLSGNSAYRAGFGLSILAGFLMVWINLAVGIIGDEDEAANLLFAGVLVVGMLGAAIGSFRPRGMARALTATAIAQGVVAGVAASLGSPEGVLISLFLAVAWLCAAVLFRKAADDAARAEA